MNPLSCGGNVMRRATQVDLLRVRTADGQSRCMQVEGVSG